MLDDSSSTDVILPLLSLKNSKYESIFVIVAVWNGDLVLFAVLSELFQMLLLLLPQLVIGEDLPLILSVLESQEPLVHGWLVIGKGLWNLIDLQDLFISLLGFHNSQ